MTDRVATTALVVGDAAPDSALADGSGGETLLSAFWTAAPRALVLVFLRHYG